VTRESLQDKLRKVEALGESPTATDGEKAAAKAAADRMRAHINHDRAKAAKASASAAEDGSLMYLLGRAWGRGRRAREEGSADPKTGTMYVLGRAWKKITSREK
jgi:hypothetical protein